MSERDDPFELPGEVREGLRGLYGPREGMGRARDAGILAAARRAGEIQSWNWWGVAMRVGVAAAIIMMVGAILLPSLGRARSHAKRAVSTADRMSVRTGDIRDAYFVARGLKEGRKLEGPWDANGDGKVDAVDVSALAMAAVRVEGGVR